MADQHQRFMEMALEEATQGLREGNNPYGAVVVRDGEVIARTHSVSTTTRDPTAHAEIRAVHQAVAALGQADLTGCILYASGEPCPMCCGAIINARISTLVLGGRPRHRERAAKGYTVERLVELTEAGSRFTLVTGVLQDRCEAMLEPYLRPR